MSWGISVRFQTLSLIQRQVAHALLTRPPLSYLDASRRINLNNSVRLECVMHAASVHPEPGSNSRKNYIIRGFASVQSFELALILSFSYFVEYISLLIDEIRISHFAYALYFSLCCSIFNDRSLPFAGQLDYYTTSLFSCQYLFWKIFKYFFAFCHRPLLWRSPRGQLDYSTICSPALSRGFWHIFLIYNKFPKVNTFFFQKASFRQFSLLTRKGKTAILLIRSNRPSLHI